MPRVRLDALLSQRGLFPSRAQAAASVLAGEVLIGADRARASKPGQMVSDDVVVDVRRGPSFVSRGAIKLSNALDAFGLPVRERSCLDVGASTGGFTDCLLQRGAARVVTVDVAYGQLDYKLRSDARVAVIERSNARALTPEMLPFTVSLAVIDVSFISVVKVLDPALCCLRAGGERWDCLAMVKPQFEVGRGAVGKGGVVRDPALRRSALESVADAACGYGAAVLGFASSGLPGPKGNRETFVWIAEPARDGALERDRIAAAALAVES